MALEREKKHRSRYLSIRTALYLAILVSIIPASLIIIATGIEHGRHLERNARDEALHQAETFAEIQIRITESTRQILSTLAALPGVEEKDWHQVTEVLTQVHHRNEDYLNFTILDSSGIVTASSLLSPGIDFHDRPHVKSAMKNRIFSTGEYVLGLIESTPSFAYSYPIIDDSGKLLGCINALYKLSSYGKLFDSFTLPPDSFLGILDRNGTRLYFYPPKETNPIGLPIKQNVWIKIQTGPERGMFSDLSSDGVPRYFGYKKLYLYPGGEPYMYVVYATPVKQVLGMTRRITLRNLAIMVAAALCGLFIAAGFFRFLFGNRLNRILEMVGRIRSGDLSARISLKGDSSDLGHIASALDSMAEAVEERDRKLIKEAENLNSSLKEKEVLLKEVNHRVKNNLQLILSMINLQKDSGKLLQEEITELESRITAISLVHEILCQGDNFGTVELGSYIENIIRVIHALYNSSGRIKLEIMTEEVFCGFEKAVPFGLLVNELLLNAYKHGFSGAGEGILRVKLTRNNRICILRVQDNGKGLPPGFTMERSRGLGLQLAESLAAQLGGTFSWEGREGTVFTVEFPVPKD